MQSDSQAISRLSQAEQARLNLPEGWKTLGPLGWGGMDQKNSRFFIADNDFFWLENLMKVGNGLLRPIYDIGSDLYDAAANGKSILSFFWFSINLIDYVTVFHTDGTAVQIRRSDGSVTVISEILNTFWQIGALQPPACAQWGVQYLLISNNFSENNYWAWDGSLLYGAGTISPIVNLTSGGANYVSTPGYLVFGGSGSGVTLIPVVVDGSVVAIEITNPGHGYLPGETPQIAFVGGGSDTSAVLQATLFPTTLEAIIVEAEGSGYAGTTTVIITPALGGAAATATISGGQVTHITVANPGSGYITAPVITFGATGGGVGAQAQATLTSSGVNTVSVANGGTNYVGVPSLTFIGDGQTQAQATAVMSGPGPIVSVDVTNSGSGYTSIPTVTVTDGGSGSGAVLSPTLTNGIVTGLTIDQGGANYTSPIITFAPPTSGTTATATASIGNGSILSVDVTNSGGGYQTAPAVIVEPTNNAAAVTLDLMPFGVSGSAIENYTSRVFLVAPFSFGPQSAAGNFLISAPESLSDFSTTAGGISQITTDSTLRKTFVNLKQSTGNLYFVGDSSTSVLSNIATGSGATGTVGSVTTFTYQNMDPQIGAAWRDTFQPFSRTIVFANSLGCWGLYGGTDTKVSEKIDNLFSAAGQINPVVPTSAVATLNSMRYYLLNKTIIDPRTQLQRTVLLAWDEKEWSVFSQSKSLIYIGTQETDTVMTAWGTDGNSLFPLFANPSATLTKFWSSKLYGVQQMYVTKQARAWFLTISDITGSGLPVNMTVDTEVGSYPIVNPNDGSSLFLIENAYPMAALTLGPSGDIYAGTLGMSFSTPAADFEIYAAQLGYTDYSAVVGDM